MEELGFGYKDLDPRGRMVHLELEKSSRALKGDDGRNPQYGSKRSRPASSIPTT